MTLTGGGSRRGQRSDGRAYRFSVRAVNIVGNSALSAKSATVAAGPRDTDWAPLTALVENPQGCLSKFPTLWRGQRSVPGRVPARSLSVRAWWSRSRYESPAMSTSGTQSCS